MHEGTCTVADWRAWARSIESHIEIGPGDCWLWTGRLDRGGYGRLRWWEKTETGPRSRREVGAHRASWLVHFGDIEDSTLVIDHLCRVRRCVNPWHMELVTIGVNVRRGDRVVDGEGGHACRKHGQQDGHLATDKHGHTRWVCRVCNRKRLQRHRERLAAAA